MCMLTVNLMPNSISSPPLVTCAGQGLARRGPALFAECGRAGVNILKFSARVGLAVAVRCVAGRGRVVFLCVKLNAGSAFEQGGGC